MSYIEFNGKNKSRIHCHLKQIRMKTSSVLLELGKSFIKT